MDIISLQDVTISNFNSCINLQLGIGQENQIVSNLYSIAESKVNPCYTPYAIYLGDTVIGFVMTDYDPSLDEKNKYWVPRMMIDTRYQGKGYGKEAMRVLMTELQSKEDCRYIRLSTEPSNKHAITFYESLGFEQTGEWLEGTEVILEYECN